MHEWPKELSMFQHICIRVEQIRLNKTVILIFFLTVYYYH